MVLNGVWLPGTTRWREPNISHGHLGEVKEILKKLGDDPFGIWRRVTCRRGSRAGCDLRAMQVTSALGGSPKLKHSRRDAGILDVLG
jgi:hypothetical protein